MLFHDFLHNLFLESTNPLSRKPVSFHVQYVRNYSLRSRGLPHMTVINQLINLGIEPL